MKKTLMAAAVAATLSTSAANAVVINLIDDGTVAGSAAELGFQVAAEYWSNLLVSDGVINLGISFASLSPGVIGSTGSRKSDFAIEDWHNILNATKSNSVIDQTIVLPTLTGPGNNGISGLTAGVDGSGNNDNSVTAVLDGTQTASQTLYMNTSLIKGMLGLDIPTLIDGSMTFSSDFSFDFNPTDGITAGTFDFLGVAIHEMGHALGFVSGVDFFDIYGTGGPGYGALGYDLNDTSIFSALDMFRYSAPGTLDFRTGGNSYFSIDGGNTALFGNTMSTGRYTGDGQQASHFKDLGGCSGQLGIMDPNFCFGQMGEVTGLDLAAYDAMGWNLSEDAMTYGSRSTSEIYAQLVPEPATWAMIIGALGFVGARRRKKANR
jgi:hypothetical protein